MLDHFYQRQGIPITLELFAWPSYIPLKHSYRKWRGRGFSGLEDMVHFGPDPTLGISNLVGVLIHSTKLRKLWVEFQQLEEFSIPASKVENSLHRGIILLHNSSYLGTPFLPHSKVT